LSDPVLLVVEDSATMRQVYAYALSDRFVVRAVERVANARAVLPEGPDLILVDAGLEEADPYEVAASLKKPLKHAKAVIVTSRFHPWDEKRAAKSGIEHHLDKPFETDSLRARLDVLLGREPLDPPAAAAPVLRPNPPKARTPKPAPAAVPPPIPKTAPVAVPVAGAVGSTAATVAAPAVTAPVKRAEPKKEISYDLNFAGGWGEEDAASADEAPAEVDPNDPFSAGWGDDGASGEAAAEVDPNDPFSAGWGEEAPAEGEAAAAGEGSEYAWGTEEEAPAEGEAAAAEEGSEYAWGTEEEAPAEGEAAGYVAGPEGEVAAEGEGWGGDFDASGFSSELTAEAGAGAVAAEGAEGAEGAEPAEAEPAAEDAEGWGGEFDATGYSSELTAEGEDAVAVAAEGAEYTEDEAAAEGAETAADGAEGEPAEAEPAAEDAEGWGGEFDATGYSSELTAEDEGSAEGAVAAEGAEYTEGEVAAEGAETAEGEEAPGDAEAEGEGWGGAFDATGYASELTADDAASPEAGSEAGPVPAAAASGSELRSLAEDLDKLGLTAAQASAVLQLTTQAIERAVWDVVPRLAERIIREELDRLTKP
jgi:CheY-like chemotaxis protein